MNRFPVSPAKARALLKRMEAFKITESDLHEMFFRPTQGKQRRRKTQTGVHLYCREFNVHIRCQKSTSQALNRFLARRELVAHLEQKKDSENEPADESTDESRLLHMMRMFSSSYERGILQPYPLESKRLSGGAPYPEAFMKALSTNRAAGSREGIRQKRPLTPR